MACNTKAGYSGAVAALGFVCFAVGAAAVGLPLWGYFENPDAGFRPDERGYFGPWQTCKQMLYNRESCGPSVSRFKPVPAVWFAGACAAAGVAALAAFCALSVLQLAMALQRERLLLSYSVAVGAKLALALLAGLLAVAAAGLFALQTDREDSFRVSRGEAFYLQVALIALDFALFVMALYDLLFARRPGGDPTAPRDPAAAAHHDAADAAGYGNLRFQERRGGGGGGGGGGIAFTDASALPYGVAGTGGAAANGSLSSVATNGSSSVTSGRSPLRSSLKKPRSEGARDVGFSGIQNPGFSGQSPPLGRNGSVKKVRIQTHSTAV